MGDYNAEILETNMHRFSKSYFLENMVKKTTCFKNPAKPTCIDLVITYKTGMFWNTKTYETGSSDLHKFSVSIMKLSYKKIPPRMIKCRDYKKFSNEHFGKILNENLANNVELDYNSFEAIVLNLLSSQAPFKNEWPRKIKEYLLIRKFKKL